jgi:hypothetical protein
VVVTTHVTLNLHTNHAQYGVVSSTAAKNSQVFILAGPVVVFMVLIVPLLVTLACKRRVRRLVVVVFVVIVFILFILFAMLFRFVEVVRLVNVVVIARNDSRQPCSRPRASCYRQIPFRLTVR